MCYTLLLNHGYNIENVKKEKTTLHGSAAYMTRYKQCHMTTDTYRTVWVYSINFRIS